MPSMPLLRSLLAALVCAAAPAPAFAADMFGVPDTGVDNPCADAKILKRIRSKFDHQVDHVPNLPDVAILDFHNIVETRYVPQDDEHPIERRYCAGQVALSDGASHDINFLIEGRMGFVGFGRNVEFCVLGFDRWRVYDGYCRTLQ